MNDVKSITNLTSNMETKHNYIPNWINSDYFVPILKQHESEFATIKQFRRERATIPGENYCSIMVRVLIEVLLKDGQSKDISYIVKTDDASLYFIQLTNFFSKEHFMYIKYLPALEAICECNGCPMQFNPKCLHVDNDKEYKSLVLEDLKQRQFSIIDMRKGFDLLHMNAVLRKLAAFHAASVVYELKKRTNQTEIFEEMFFDTVLTDVNYDAISSSQILNRKMFLKAIPTWDLDPTVVKKYLNAFPSAEDYCQENRFTCQVHREEFNVLNHGDCRANNIMFRYTPQDEIEETIFIDFQTCKWGPPSQDLWYLIITSAALDIQIKNFDHFIQVYHECLLECLKALNYRKRLPTLRDFHKIMIRDAFWGLFAFHTILPAILLPGNDDASVENMMKPGPEGEHFRFKAYTNPDFVVAARQLCPFLYDKGAFEVTFKRK